MDQTRGKRSGSRGTVYDLGVSGITSAGKGENGLRGDEGNIEYAHVTGVALPLFDRGGIGRRGCTGVLQGAEGVAWAGKRKGKVPGVWSVLCGGKRGGKIYVVYRGGVAGQAV